MDINQTFNNVVLEAIKSAKNIVESKDKAIALAEIAKALAMTNQVSLTTTMRADASEKKESLKNKPTPKKQEATLQESEDEVEKMLEATLEEEDLEEDKEGNCEEETTEEVDYENDGEITDEDWTQEAFDKYSKEIKYIKDITVKKTPKVINGHLAEFSKGSLNDVSEVSPSNIKGIYCFLKSLYPKG